MFFRTCHNSVLPLKAASYNFVVYVIVNMKIASWRQTRALQLAELSLSLEDRYTKLVTVKANHFDLTIFDNIMMFIFNWVRKAPVSSNTQIFITVKERQ